MRLSNLFIALFILASNLVMAETTAIPNFLLNEADIAQPYKKTNLIQFGVHKQSAEEDINNWFNQDPDLDLVQGVSSDRLHSLIEIPYARRDVIVAVIDSGVDIRHPDLRGKIWINKKEIPKNGIDDDNNGYIDDVYGWNFLGGRSGRDLEHETLIFTREARRFANIKKKRALTAREKKYYERAAGTLYAKRYQADRDLSVARAMVPKTPAEAKRKAARIKYYEAKLRYHLNPRYNPRAKVIGDNPKKIIETGYGNNHVWGPVGRHGTHVAGIIAANRNNRIGSKGVASRVKIMSLRAVPDGDEYDKDIVNAIYYAVNNGAKIINMSFGKTISPYKAAVDRAIIYAKKHGVLFFNAAGNDGKSNDLVRSYPNRFVRSGGEHANFIEVGASRSNKMIFKDTQGGLHGITASFSNYGKKNVDLFAPGVQIYSTVPGGKYEHFNGTSMAAPVAAGVAALIWSIKPSLSAKQLKSILLRSVKRYRNWNTILPGTRDRKVKFSALSKTGGIINAVRAAKMLNL